MGQRGERGGEAQWNRNRPRQRETEARVRRTTGEQDHGGERGSGCEHGVLEDAEPEHAGARLVRFEAGRLECMPVDHEAGADDERAESGRDDRTRPGHAEPWASFEPCDLAVGDDVAEIGG